MAMWLFLNNNNSNNSKKKKHSKRYIIGIAHLHCNLKIQHLKQMCGKLAWIIGNVKCWHQYFIKGLRI